MEKCKHKWSELMGQWRMYSGYVTHWMSLPTPPDKE